MMKTADYYIEKVLMHEYSDEQWLQLDEEIDRWREAVAPEERIEFAESGAGEMLYMICSAIKIRRAKDVS